jgi:hypothetical protein
MRSFVFYCCTPHLNLINLYIVLVCHKNSIWYCHWGTSVRGANVIGEQVFEEQMSLGSKCSGSKCLWGASVIGEQVSLGSKCHWGASVIGQQLSREQLSLGSKCPGSNCRGSNCLGSKILDTGKIISFEEVNRLAFQKLSRSQCKAFSKKDHQSNNDKQDEDEDCEEYLSQKQSSGNNIIDDYDESMASDESDADVLPNVSSSTFRGMRIFDSINSYQTETFFPVEVNGQKKFMHKQAANWYFSKTKPTLSSDRSMRVQKK